VIHRDVSPANVLLSRQGEVKLTDFGVAKAAGQLNVTRAEEIKGKLAYMAPEQAWGRVERRSDLFSLAAVLYEMLCGWRLRDNPRLEQVREGVEQALAVLGQQPSISPALLALVDQCLAADPEQRPANAAIVRRRLTDELYAVQQRQGERGDMHALLGAFVAGQGPSAPRKGDAPDSSEQDRVAADARRVAQQVMENLLQVPTDHGEVTGSLSQTTPMGGPASGPTGEPSGPVPAAEGRRLNRRALVALSLVLLALAGLFWWIAAVPGPDEEGRELAVGVAADDAATAPTPPREAEARRTRSRDAELAVAAPLVADAAAPDGTRRRRARRRPVGQGQLDVNALPWARVYVDGKLRGETPIQGMTLRAGVHRLRLVNPRWKVSHEETVRIVAGQRVRRVFRLQ
jgi:hypothetical protein